MIFHFITRSTSSNICIETFFSLSLHSIQQHICLLAEQFVGFTYLSFESFVTIIYRKNHPEKSTITVLYCAHNSKSFSITWQASKSWETKQYYPKNSMLSVNNYHFAMYTTTTTTTTEEATQLTCSKRKMQTSNDIHAYKVNNFSTFCVFFVYFFSTNQRECCWKLASYWMDGLDDGELYETVEEEFTVLGLCENKDSLC